MERFEYKNRDHALARAAELYVAGSWSGQYLRALAALPEMPANAVVHWREKPRFAFVSTDRGDVMLRPTPRNAVGGE
jgi:hypothetical protein